MSESARNSDRLPAFVSRQVTVAQRFFLSLNPDPRSRLQVVCGGVERMRPDYVVERSDFPYFAVELVTEGNGTLVIDGTVHRLTAGVAFAYGPGVVHKISSDANRPMRKYYLDFVGTDAQQLLQQTGLLEGSQAFRPIAVDALHEVVEMFDVLIKNCSQRGPLVDSISESLALLVMLKLRQLRLPGSSVLPKSYATYQRVRRVIEERFLELHTIQEVAAECDMTAVYLSRLFNRFANCGAYQYLMRQKMNHAAGLLMNEGMLVKEVASRMEFADAFQFSRAFKRVYGITPGNLVARDQG